MKTVIKLAKLREMIFWQPLQLLQWVERIKIKVERWLFFIRFWLKLSHFSWKYRLILFDILTLSKILNGPRRLYIKSSLRSPKSCIKNILYYVKTYQVLALEHAKKNFWTAKIIELCTPFLSYESSQQQNLLWWFSISSELCYWYDNDKCFC